MLLYGAECWIPLRKHLWKIDAFHHWCIRVTLGLTRRDQWTQHLTSQSLKRCWSKQLSTRITRQRLEWLDNVARMTTHRIPKQVLFGRLPQPRPGPRRRWRDLKAIGVTEDRWYEDATISRAGWRVICRESLEECEMAQNAPSISAAHQRIRCHTCNRDFHRPSDMARKKCIDERQKPLGEQWGAVQCDRCSRCFRSRGGHAVHTSLGRGGN